MAQQKQRRYKVSHKVCRKCKAEKPASDFYSHRSNLDGLGGSCKECCKQYSRANPSYVPVEREPLPHNVKRCTKCDEVKPVTDFGPSKTFSSGRRADCRVCVAAYKKSQYYEHTSRYIEASNRWSRENPERVRAGKQKPERQHHACGVTKGEFAEMKAAQNYECAICHAPDSAYCLDHDHATGLPRAALCQKCNWGLGFFKDNPDRLDAAAEYLRFHARKAKLA